MFVVALLKLATPPDLEAQALAADLGVTGFEAGQLVRGHLPSIVFKSGDGAKAQALLDRLRARGHEALRCEVSTVHGAEAMHELRGFRLEGDALVSLNQNGTSERLPWGEVTALVRAMHRVLGTSVETTRERQFDLGRAVITQGLSLSKEVKKQTVREADQREPVLYLFRRDGAPWRASESRCRYDGLGSALGPARQENFNTLVRQLRARLPEVPFDERLVSVRAGGDRVQADLVGAQRSTSNAGTVELFAHLVAMSLLRPASSGAPAAGSST